MQSVNENNIEKQKKICFNYDYQHQAINAAHDLHYGRDVIDKIKSAKTDAEIDRIMRNARHEKFGEKGK